MKLLHTSRVVLLFLLSLNICLSARAEVKFHPQFIKVNSETRANIRRVFAPDTSCTYFLTDKIFAREGTQWKRLNLPDARTIDLFFPLAKDDFWYTANTPLHTSVMYHYDHGRTEKVTSPFANEIIALCFPGKNLGFISGWFEMAVYAEGVVGRIPPTPSMREIIKTEGTSVDRFWCLSAKHELFQYSGKVYRRMLQNRIVNDFCMEGPGHGFILCEDAVFEYDHGRFSLFFESQELKKVRKLAVYNKTLLFIGSGGFISMLQDKTYQRLDFNGKEELLDILVSGQGEIWITGEKGLLLYSGQRKMHTSEENIPGFTKYKIYKYGGEADDEYGVAIADFNGDGKNDIYSVCIFNPDRLYMNYCKIKETALSTHNFFDEAMKRGALGIPEMSGSVAPSELKLGVAVGDIDNDGDQDIYICSLNGKNKLLLNDGNGYFRDVSSERNRACFDLNRSNTAAFADVDGDGDLDLFVTSEKGSNKLYLNDGTGRFTDVTVKAGLATVRGGMCSSFADINNDGLPDLCVSSWFGSDKIYLNVSSRGKVHFRDITAFSDLARQEPGRSNAVVFADVNNDGLPDLFIARRNSPNKLYINKGHGIFRDATKQYFAGNTYLSNGAVFADFDLDGFLDLYITNVGENILYKNVGGKYFTETTDDFGADLSGYCTGCAAGDLDGDGDPDLYVANYTNGSSLLFINNSDPRNSVKIIPEGCSSNRDAIGAKVFLYKMTADGGKVIAGSREINGGSGYGSLSAREAIFALPAGAKYSAIIEFPASGRKIEVNEIHPGDVLYVSEESGFAAFLSLSYKSMHRFFLDPDSQLEIFKYLLVLGFFCISIYIHSRKPLLRMNILATGYILLLILFAICERLLRYQALGFSFIIPVGILLILLILFHLVTERIQVKRSAAMEKQQVRESISRDLHDDLASTLGSISIYSNTLKEFSKKTDENDSYLADKIADLSHTALQSIADIIWMTSPRHDSLKSLLSKTRNYYYDLFNDNLVKFSSDIELPGKDVVLPDKLRHNIFLILKEVANNIIRHAGASNVSLKSAFNDGHCAIMVNDDGVGFSTSTEGKDNNPGNGLVNMRRRAEESGIELHINSNPGKGTSIQLIFKMTQTDH